MSTGPPEPADERVGMPVGVPPHRDERERALRGIRLGVALGMALRLLSRRGTV